jgi:integrase
MQANAHVLASAPSLMDKLTGQTHTVAALLAKMPASEVANTAKSLRSIDKIISAALGRVQCLDLTVAKCSELIESITAEGKARSAQAVRSRLIAVCQKGQQLGWLESNPAEVTGKPRAEVQRGRLTLETFWAIYDQAPNVNEWLQHAMRLALVTGQDRSTVATMTRSMVQTIEGQRVLVVHRSKTRAKNKPVAIPLRLRLDALGWMLEDVLAHRTGVVSPYYLHHISPHSNAAPGSPVFVDRISRAFTEARILAGIPDEGAPTFHELRSLAKRLYDKQGGVDTQQLLGHASEKTAALYADARGVEALLVRVA